jgi:hypothetical protein
MPGASVVRTVHDELLCVWRPQSFSDVFPHLVTATNVPKLVKIDDVNFGDVDAAFCCLPHATTQVRRAWTLLGRALSWMTLPAAPVVTPNHRELEAEY